MPITLMARVASEYPDDITDSEREVVDSYLAYTWDQMSTNYNPYISDPVTGYSLKGECSTASFFKVWLQIGLRHPLTYLNAFFSLESGWISFSGAPSVQVQQDNYLQYPLLMEPTFVSSYNEDTFGQLLASEPESWGQSVVEQVYRWASRTPGINALCYVASWTAVLPAFLLYEYLRSSRPRTLLFALVPYLISCVSLFVYPVSLSAQMQDPTRYMFHMLLLAPLVVGFTLLSIQSRSRDVREVDSV